VYYSNLNFTRYMRDPYDVYENANEYYGEIFGQPAGTWMASWR